MDFINIVKNRKYTIESETYLQADQRYHESKNTMQLTSGVFAESGIKPSEINRDTECVYRAFRGISRNVIFTLDEYKSVYGFKALFTTSRMHQTWAPRRVSLSVSVNGTAWEKIISMDCPDDIRRGDDFVTVFEKTLDTPYKAKYLKLNFSVDIVTVCGGIEIFGCDLTGDAILPIDNTVVTEDKGYLPLDRKYLEGMRDVILMYNYVYSENENEQAWGLNDEKKLLPYVAHLDRGGNIKGTMFDSFMWLPFVRQGPSGGTYHADWRHPNKLIDWLEYRKNLFADGYNLKALNSCVAKVGKELGNDDLKIKIILCIPYPSYCQTDFGDPLSRGRTMDLSDPEDRLEIVKWYIDTTIEQFEAAELDRLELKAFYWFEEQMFYNDPHEKLIEQVSDYLHSKSLGLTWIPFYQASGFYEGPSLGFDAVCMQPNLAFNEGFEHTVVRDTADQAKKYGLCVEIEIADQAVEAADEEYIARYYAYLDYLAETRVMTDTVHMYYQNGGPGLFYTCCFSSNDKLREIYDDTHLFIEKKYRSKI